MLKLVIGCGQITLVSSDEPHLLNYIEAIGWEARIVPAVTRNGQEGIYSMVAEFTVCPHSHVHIHVNVDMRCPAPAKWSQKQSQSI